jgi:transposase
MGVYHMAMPLPNKTREAIVAHKINGKKEAEIAKWLCISKSSVTKTWALFKQRNSVDPKPHNKGRKPAFGQDVMDKIIAKIKEQPDVTLEELVEGFNLNISISALCRKLQKLNLNFKKRHYSPKNSSEKMCKYFVGSG